MSNTPRKKASRRNRNTPPGSAIYTGEARDAAIRVQLIDYTADALREEVIERAAVLRSLASDATVSWINLDGIHLAEEVQAVCQAFGVHPLWMEDILNPSSRPKAEVLDGRLLVIAKMIHSSDGQEIDAEQVSVVLLEGVVLTFQQRPGDAWEPLRERIRSGRGRVRRMGADYLLHALLDAVVDAYFAAIEGTEERLVRLEDRAMDPSAPDVELRTVYALRTELGELRRVVRPMREVAGQLLREDDSPVLKGTRPYFQDLSDHVSQLMDALEAGRERTVQLLELQLALDGHRLNENMRVLTVISSVFIPLTFIAGIYGMNFQNMPELSFPWAYPVVLGVMVLMAAAMIVWFRRRHWL